MAADNRVFAKGGVEYIISKLVAFSRACFSIPFRFCNFTS